LTAFVDTFPVIVIELFAMFVEIPAPQIFIQGLVIYVEKLKGKLATLTLRLLLVTNVEKLKGKLATLTLRLLLITKEENVLGNRKATFKVLTEAET
jgi:hypothetical protein